MNDQQLLEELVKIFSEAENDQIISKDVIRSFMESNDLEILGALSSFLDKQKYYQQIKPPLTFDEWHQFNLKYFKKCLLEDRKGEWSESRYEAGWAFTRLFSALFNDPTVPKAAISDLKHLVEELYESGDTKLRTALIDAILEHLFQEAEIREFFFDWKTNPLLQSAYDESVEIAKTMPKLSFPSSPLTNNQTKKGNENL